MRQKSEVAKEAKQDTLDSKWEQSAQESISKKLQLPRVME